MTVNQVIVLLDIRRGFDKSRHHGTVDEDVKMLLKAGLVCQWNHKAFPYILSARGQEVVERLLEQAAIGAGGLTMTQGDSTITAHDGLLWRGKESIPLTEADRVAQSHGYPYAELLVKALSEGRKISPDKQQQKEC